MQQTTNAFPFIRLWIIASITLVVLMVLIGGITRLTESGLSIVEWKPVSGVFPPMSEEAWTNEFDAYKATPEFKQKNFSFDVHQFKRIFWLEYIHRLLGRITGLVFLLPLVYFGVKRQISPQLFKRMAIITVLCGLQGGVGWIMVASGLVDQPRVAPVKLGIHLLLAASIFAMLLDTYLRVMGVERQSFHRGSALAIRLLLVAVLFQMFLGALVAGLDAGMVYNTFPLMDGKIAPTPLYITDPWWVNHLEYIPLVQFQHRVGGILLTILTFGICYYVYPNLHAQERDKLKRIIWVLIAQFGLGVYTLMTAVNIVVASLHQLTALLLIAVVVRILYALPFSKPEA